MKLKNGSVVIIKIKYQEGEWERSKSEQLCRRIRCPHCVWWKFKDEAVGMTPCPNCNSTGYIYEEVKDEPETVWAEFYPDGSMTTEGYPPIDLNSLFKYAVPAVFLGCGEASLGLILDRWVDDILRGITSYNPEEIALALFQTIYEAFGGKE